MTTPTVPAPSILVCTPAYGGNMNFEYVLSLLRLEKACQHAGITLDYSFLANESLIPRARNYLCAEFLEKSHVTHLLFVDADIQFQPDDVIRMIRADVPVLGGLYPKKRLNWERMQLGKQTAPMLDYVIMPNNNSPPITDIYQPQPVRFIGTGLMLIQRKVLNEMLDKEKDNPDFWYWADNKKYFKFFDCITKDQIYLSEDYFFCERWRELGGTVHAAYWTRCTHWGIFGFAGNVVESANA